MKSYFFMMNLQRWCHTLQMMRRITIVCMLVMPMAVSAQKQYFLPTGDPSAEEKDRPMIEVYLPESEMANGCAVVLCPGGAMRWLSWESDVVKMASFLNKHGIAAIGLRYHLNHAPMSQGMKKPEMVDVTHPERFSSFYFMQSYSRHTWIAMLGKAIGQHL